ncbi:MAG: long-chain-fatty-acid--CoA ligase [Hyphomonadaceae bacterium]
MLGLMQNWPLTVDRILDHANSAFPSREVVTRAVEDGQFKSTTYASIASRAKQVTNALRERSITLGDRVATLAWNTDRHLEAWYGAMGMGAVLHTLNPRLFPEQIAWIVNHAEDKIIFFDITFAPIVEKIAPLLKTVQLYVAFTDRANLPQSSLPMVAYEDFIAGQSTEARWGGFDENTACGLCYTSGTTGDPKGVLYSHRSNVIHAMAANQTDVFGCGARDVVLPIVPMFHANAWAIAFVAPMCGSKLVMPGAKLDGQSVYELLEGQKVTFTAAVPTVWQGLMGFLRENKLKPTTLKRVAIGGSAIPETVLRAFEEDYGVEVIHAWGMTEMSPIGTTGKLLPQHYEMDHESQIKAKMKQGRVPFTVEMKIVDDEGKILPHDGKVFGRLQVRGPSVARAYFKNAGAKNERGECLETCGYFDTGDVATIDPLGIMQITDRAKDVIKSGGEWISSIDIENIAMGADGVANAAVIGVAHPKWDERPLLIIQPRPGAKPTKESVLKFLEGKIAKWWTPDDVQFVEAIPLGATGKINKLALREQFKDYKLPTTQAAE